MRWLLKNASLNGESRRFKMLFQVQEKNEQKLSDVRVSCLQLNYKLLHVTKMRSLQQRIKRGYDGKAASGTDLKSFV